MKWIKNHIFAPSKKYFKNLKLRIKMTKADIVANISDKSGIEKADVLATVEAFMEEVKGAENGDNVYLRGFGSFIIKKELRKLEETSLRIRR